MFIVVMCSNPLKGTAFWTSQFNGNFSSQFKTWVQVPLGSF